MLPLSAKNQPKFAKTDPENATANRVGIASVTFADTPEKVVSNWYPSTARK